MRHVAKPPTQDPTLWALCAELGRPLDAAATHNGEPLDGARLLWTLAGVESAWGEERLFARHEPAYMPGGKYYKAAHMRELWGRYGVLAASSLGTWQVLPVTAWELGFRRHPIDLQEDSVGGYWAEALIERRLIGRQGARTLVDILDAYNTGTHRDRLVPGAYVSKGVAYYETTAVPRVPPPEAQEEAK